MNGEIWEEDFLDAPVKHTLDLESAIQTLRVMALDPFERIELRRLWAEHMGTASIHLLSDDVVLREIAHAVVVGRLELPKRFQHKPYILPPEKLDELEGYFEKLASKGKKPLSLINPRWSKPRTPVDTYVEAMFTYSGFEPGQEVTVITYEFNAGGSRKQVGEPMALTVEADAGDHTFRWKRTADEAQADLEEDQREGDRYPLEFRFTVESEEAGFAGFSGPLWLTNTVTVNLKNEHDDSAHERPKVVVLKDYERQQRKRTEEGKVCFEEVIVGPVDIWIAEPRFRDLRWSKDRVPVGEAVDAIFRYEDAIEGMKVAVIVHEFDADGTSKEIERFEGVELGGERGEMQVSFSRTEDEAGGDLKEDEAAGEKTPVEYRFYVVGEGGGVSEASGRLWLTNTVVVNLKNEHDESTHEQPKVVVLKDYEREQRKRSEGGKAKFEDVLVGPVEIWLARPRFTELSWSKDRVLVGEEVEAVFRYEDAMEGMKVTVVVVEMDTDGTVDEIERIEGVELGGVLGEARVPFTRTEDEAQADAMLDEREGELGPVEYRYYVVGEDGGVSGRSGRLWLTHVVEIKLEHKGKPFPDGVMLELKASDGLVHRGSLEGGKVKFENVVFGPMVVRMAGEVQL